MVIVLRYGSYVDWYGWFYLRFINIIDWSFLVDIGRKLDDGFIVLCGGCKCVRLVIIWMYSLNID